MLQKYTSIAICYLLATTSSGIVVSANNNNDRTAELYNDNNANGSSGRGNDGANERRSFLNLGRRHFNHRTLLSNNNKQRQQDTSNRSLQVEEATQLSEAQTVKEEAEQIMLSSSPEAQSAISQTINDIQTNPDLSPLEKETMLKLLKVEATEVQSQVIEDESHINSSKKKKMEKLNEEITNVEVVKDELDVAIQQVEQDVIKETLLKGTEGQKFNNNNLSQPIGDKKYPTKAPSTIGIADGGGGDAYMKKEPTASPSYFPSTWYPTYSPFVKGETPTYSPSLPEPTYSPTELEPTMSPSPSGSSSGSSHSPSPSHDALTTSKSGKNGGKSGKSGGKGKSGKSGGTKSHKMDPSFSPSPTMDSLQPTDYTPSPSPSSSSSGSSHSPSPTNHTPFPTTDSPTPAPNTPRPSDDSTKEPSHPPTSTPSHGPSDQPTGMPSHGPSMAPTTIQPTVPIGSTFYDGFEEGNTNFPNEPWSVSSSLDGMLGIDDAVDIAGGGISRRRLQDVAFERVLEEDDDETPTMSPSPSGTWWTYHPSTIWPPTDLPTQESTQEPTPEPTPNPTRRPPDPPQAFTRRPTSPPSSSPTEVPTKQPSSNPSKAPSTSPTSTPTSMPTSAPTPKEVNWAITNEMSYTGIQSIKSPQLSCGDGYANVTLSLDETIGPYPGNLSFWYYCDDSPSEGGLHWHVDGEMKGSSDDTMTNKWMMEDLMIESPGHVTWSYVYDCNGDSEMDIMDEAGTAYIDVVTFKPHLSPTGLPTSTPSHNPTHEPSSEPSHSPTSEPSHDSLAPSDDPLPDCPASDRCFPEEVCEGAQGPIECGSCLGATLTDETCVDLDGFVGTDSCWGLEACKNLTGRVGDKSCISPHACQNSDKAEIGSDSCKGPEACKDNTADISDGSCQGGEACTMNKANIGENSCQSSSKACFHNEGSIGDNSCTTTIGILDGTENDSAVSMCENNKGTIGNNSCNGFMACTNNVMEIMDNSCNGFMACYNNTNVPLPAFSYIPSGQCNGERCLSDNPGSSCSPCVPTIG